MEVKSFNWIHGFIDKQEKIDGKHVFTFHSVSPNPKPKCPSKITSPVFHGQYARPVTF